MLLSYLLTHVASGSICKARKVLCSVGVTGCVFLQQKSKAFKHNTSNTQKQANFNSCLLQAIAYIKEAL